MRSLLLPVLFAAAAAAQVPSEYGACPSAVRTVAESLRSTYSLNGVQIAAAPNGRLTCAAALGYAAPNRAMTTTTLMRIGSVSKTITGMAIAKLLDDGKLSLDDKAISFIPDLLPAAGPADARWRNVTLRHLAQHSTGWDRAIGGEPIQNSRAISAAFGIRGPATSYDAVRWWLQQPLHFDPGTKASYTGIEYALLAIVVERVSGLPYERYVAESLLAPLGIYTSMRIGRTLPEGRAFPADAALFEAAYSVPPGTATVQSVFPYITAPVERPYGEWYNESLEGSGGWIANAPGLLKYVNRLFGRGGPAFFKQSTVDAIYAKPSYAPASSTLWYGLGWQVVQYSGGLGLRFAGSLRGTMAEIGVRPNLNSYALLTNTSAADPDAAGADIYNQLNSQFGSLQFPGNDLYATPAYTDSTAAAPRIRAQKGVVHGASFEPGITAGSWFSILGWNLASTTRLWAAADFNGTKLPTRLDGVEVRINGQSAAVYYVSPTQINAQVPSITTPGTATLEVIRDGIASTPEPIEIRAASPEPFLYAAGGKLYVAAVHLDGAVAGDPAVVPGVRAAAAGTTLQLFGTGFAPAPAGEVVSTVVPVAATTVTVNGQPAAVSFSGLVATGLFQINLTVPNLPPGDYPVRIAVGGAGSLASGILAVR